MEFRELIVRRRSVRAFTSAPIAEEVLASILEAVRSAPTAGNLQAFRVKVVRDEGTKRAVCAAAYNQTFLVQAPVVLAFLTDADSSKRRYGSRGRDLYALQDATIACLYAHLAAADAGLGSVWVGAFVTADVAKALDAPGGLTPVALLPIGHPAEEPEATSRKPLGELLL